MMITTYKLVVCLQVTLLGYALDTFPQGFAKGDLQNALDGLEWGASCVSINLLMPGYHYITQAIDAS